MNRSILVLVSATMMMGCLKTRAEIEAEKTGRVLERQTIEQQQASQAPAEPRAESALRPSRVGGQTIKSSSQAHAHSEELDEQMRAMNGRIESLEGLVERMQNAEQQKKEAWLQDQSAQGKKLQAYEDAIRKLDAQIVALNEKIEKLENPPPPPEPPPAAAPAAGKAAAKGSGPYEMGEELFGQKKWKDAARSFQKYRDQNAKGKSYADATYKIGVCFQELGMKDEAKAFFDEVMTKFPNSKEAKKAAVRMKSLK